MREVRFLCLAVSRRQGGSCIAGIDLDEGQWIRPVHGKTHSAFGDFEIFASEVGNEKPRILAPLDVLQLRLDRYVGSNVQPENWETPQGAYEAPFTVSRRFDASQDAEILKSCLDREGPLLHSYGDRISMHDPLLKQPFSKSLSLVQPKQLHWRVSPHPTYANRLQVRADFHFAGDSNCLVVTDPIWEARCRRFGSGRHPHSAIAGDEAVAGDGKQQVLLTISLAEAPMNGYHYKLAAAVLILPGFVSPIA